MIKFDLTNKKFGALFVIKLIVINNKSFWECKCDCGKIINQVSSRLRNGTAKSCGCIGKKIDISGQKFGYLLAQHRIIENNKSKWQCLCVCGKNINVLTGALKAGDNKSCGCKTIELMAKSHIVPNGLINKYFYNYKQGAKYRNIDFSILFDEFLLLINNNCFYCGESPSLHEYWKFQKRKSYFLLANGIDRINNNLGYFKDNCVSCCTICNLAKAQYSLQQFQYWISNLIKHKSHEKIVDINNIVIYNLVSILYKRYKSDAKKRNLLFNITLKKFKTYILNNCFYCGIPPFLKIKATKKKDVMNNLFMNYNGIDRVNNLEGYTIKNCVTACVFCNRGKRAMSYENFENWINKIYDHNT